MKPEEFVNFASELATSATSGSAAHRSAASRAYYGVYHAVRSLIERELHISCKSVAGGNEHKLVNNFLANCHVVEAEEIARLLGNLQQSRIDADYKLDETSPETRVNSELCVARANGLLAKLKACSAAPLKQKIIAGMSQYYRLRTGR